MSARICQSAIDEVRHDVVTGELYDTGFTLLCAANAEPGLLFCHEHAPRSANRNAPYTVRSGFYLETFEEFALFADALSRYAAQRAQGHGAVLTGARVDGAEDACGADGLDDEERELLGMLP